MSPNWLSQVMLQLTTHMSSNPCIAICSPAELWPSGYNTTITTLLAGSDQSQKSNLHWHTTFANSENRHHHSSLLLSSSPKPCHQKMILPQIAIQFPLMTPLALIPLFMRLQCRMTHPHTCHMPPHLLPTCLSYP